MTTITLTVDDDGIALITIDCPGRPVNVYTPELTAELTAAVERVIADPAVAGAVIVSGKDGFLAGADLKSTHAAIERALAGGAPPDFCAENRLMRRIETGGKPFAAAIHGAALGGGLELALACHFRVGSDAGDTVIGLPEVQVGLLPAGGGTQRLPRMIGIEAALPLLLEGNAVPAAQALALGVLDAVVPRAELIATARTWLRAHPQPSQPWDRKGWQMPGSAGALAAHANRTFYAGMAQVRARTQGNYPAPLAILSAVYEGTQLPFDAAMAVEARYFAQLAADPVARNLIRTQFLNRKRYAGLAHRPAGVPASRVRTLGVLGAGMMGAGIAHAAARAGLSVVLLDGTQAHADAGKARAVAIGTRADGEAGGDSIDTAISATARYDDLSGCDYIIEAVFEDRSVKSTVLASVCEVVGHDVVVASNTSTLPITGLAACTDRPARFIGMHFFSPVERMPLLEIIVGEQTSPDTLARSMDLARQLGKTPIVVNDSPGFFTSRIFCAYVDEAMAMLAEGVTPALIENAARMAGFAAPPLAVLDEVSLDLQQRVVNQAIADGLDPRFLRLHGQPVIARMNVLGRLGRKAGAGFYDYPRDGRKRLWPGLAQQFPLQAVQPDVDTVRQRLLCMPALESVRCLEEGVIGAPADGDIGAILGLGFPAWTGGPLSLIETIGVAEFVRRCDALAAAHGARYLPTEGLRARVGSRMAFYPGEAA
jgi:3-hydroxyacyl-CoA dehydrogenase/enoyl-CoA hydratase/3-hydroxybutyryl-CoA epimerase